MPIRVVVEKVIPADRETVFHTVPDTTSNWKVFFTGFKPFVGAITAAEIEGGGPVVPGARRHVDFSDHTHIVEEIIDHDFPSLHHYRVAEPTKIQQATMSMLDSQWEFIAEGEDSCRIRWTYTLIPRSIVDYPLVRTVGAYGFRGAMRNCLETIEAYFAERAADGGVGYRAERDELAAERRARNLRKAALVGAGSLAALALLRRQSRRRRTESGSRSRRGHETVAAAASGVDSAAAARVDSGALRSPEDRPLFNAELEPTRPLFGGFLGVMGYTPRKDSRFTCEIWGMSHYAHNDRIADSMFENTEGLDVTLPFSVILSVQCRLSKKQSSPYVAVLFNFAVYNLINRETGNSRQFLQLILAPYSGYKAFMPNGKNYLNLSFKTEFPIDPERGEIDGVEYQVKDHFRFPAIGIGYRS